MIVVTIVYRNRSISIICDSAKSVTGNSVSCYWYKEEKVEHYKGRMVYVRSV
jgi:hypothetical protein